MKISKPKVFISYAHEDEVAAMEIYEFLKANNCSPWIDIHDLKTGQDWKLEIDKAIQTSNFFIACLSSHSVSKRGYVQKELKSALSVLDLMPEGRVYLLPVRLNECVIPYSLSSRQWLDWTTPNAKKKILEAMGVTLKPDNISKQEQSENEDRAWKAELLHTTKHYRSFRIHLSTSRHWLSMDTTGKKLKVELNGSIVFGEFTSGHPSQVIVQLTDGKISRDVIIRSIETPGMGFLKNVQIKIDGVVLYNEI